ncbi:MAG: hypothetical protein ACI8ZM_004474 [Crocinitomix sp.]|jgi:hypothetical protein
MMISSRWLTLKTNLEIQIHFIIRKNNTYIYGYYFFCVKSAENGNKMFNYLV